MPLPNRSIATKIELSRTKKKQQKNALAQCIYVQPVYITNLRLQTHLCFAPMLPLIVLIILFSLI